MSRTKDTRFMEMVICDICHIIVHICQIIMSRTKDTCFMEMVIT